MLCITSIYKPTYNLDVCVFHDVTNGPQTLRSAQSLKAARVSVSQANYCAQVTAREHTSCDQAAFNNIQRLLRKSMIKSQIQQIKPRRIPIFAVSFNQKIK